MFLFCLLLEYYAAMVKVQRSVAFFRQPTRKIHKNFPFFHFKS